jgi:UDP-glucose:glycoprotein glucosyltransferase
LYEGVLTEDMAPQISTYFYDLPTTAKRRNHHIYPQPGGLRVFNLVDLFSQAGFNSSATSFVHVSSSVDPLSVFVVGDLDGDEGFALVKEILLALVCRKAFIIIKDVC